MPVRDDEPKSDLDDDLGAGKRVSFRDYPSTGLVVLAALVSGLGWLAYKWTDGKRGGRPSTAGGRREELGPTKDAPASESLPAEPPNGHS